MCGTTVEFIYHFCSVIKTNLPQMSSGTTLVPYQQHADNHPDRDGDKLRVVLFGCPTRMTQASLSAFANANVHV